MYINDPVETKLNATELKYQLRNWPDQSYLIKLGLTE